MEVSLACVVVRSAGRSVAGWWLGGAVRCGCLAGSVLWGPGRAARAGGSGRRPWGCPPWGPVPWSRVLWGFRSLALVAVAVPSSFSGACEVALVAAGVVAWRLGRGGAPCGGVPCGFLSGCGPFSPCRCALHSPCGFRWPVGVRWCDPYGVRCLLRQSVLGGDPPGVVGRSVGVGRRWSPRRGMPFLGVGRGVCRGALSLRALVPASAPSWFLGSFLPPCGVSSGALSLGVPVLTWGPPVPSCLSAPWCPLPSPCPCPSPSWCGGSGRGGVGRGRRRPRPGGG